MNHIHLEELETENPVERIVELLQINWHLDKLTLLGDNLRSMLEDLFDELSSDVRFLFEAPYVDKVYRDSYYHYYSTKHSAYERNCVRLSLFQLPSSERSIPECILNLNSDLVFLGFITLRPTAHAPIGRSILSPKAFERHDFSICSTSYNVSILGQKFKLEGFPHSSQDGETITCAETSVWGLMEYFGHRYAEYTPTLPSKIHQALLEISNERQIPSSGLKMDEISFVLKRFGFGTVTYSNSAFDNRLHDLIKIYLDSGIPVVIGLEAIGTDDEYAGHAIIGIGLHEDQEKIIIQDDNHHPYRSIKMDKPGALYADKLSQAYVIDSIVVPLYPKIYLEANLAENIAKEVFKDPVFGKPDLKNVQHRIFLSSSRTFKSHILKLTNLNPKVKSLLLNTRMPKFIWLLEISDIGTNKHKGLIVLDGTEANDHGMDALIAACYPEEMITYNDNIYHTFAFPFVGYEALKHLK